MKYILIIIILILFQAIESVSQVKALEDLNTEENCEYSPSISFDGKTMVFESNMSGYWRLYESQRMGEMRWSGPTYMTDINSTVGRRRFIGGCFQSYDGQFLLMTSDRKDGLGNMDILISEKENGAWTMPRNIGAPVNSEYYEGFPSLYTDGNELYFMRKLKQGQSSENERYYLYVSKRKKNGDWGEPAPLCDEINKYPVECPRIFPNGQSLMFASKRPDSKGGFDLYRCNRLDDGSWGRPENMDQINSIHDENTFTVDASGELLYFAITSNGLDDLYVYRIPEPDIDASTIQLLGRVLDAETRLPVPAEIMLIDSDSEETIKHFSTSNEKTEFEIYLPKGRNMLIEATSPGYSFASEQLLLKSPELNLDKTKGKRMELREIFDQLILEEKDRELLNASMELISQANKTILKDIKDNSNKIDRLKIQGKAATDLRSKKKLQAEEEKLKTENRIFEKEAINKYRLANHDIHSLLKKYIVRYQVSSNERISNLGRTLEDEGSILWQQAKNERLAADNNQNSSNVKESHSKAKELESKAMQKYALAFEYYLQYLNFNKNQIKKDIYLTPLKKDVSIVLENIQFDFDSDALKAESFYELEKVLRLLNENPKLKIELSAHTDSKGSDTYNMDLSDRRAGSVVRWLTGKEVPLNRLKAVGYGESSPKVPNDTEENRAINRRVEFKILEN